MKLSRKTYILLSLSSFALLALLVQQGGFKIQESEQGASCQSLKLAWTEELLMDPLISPPQELRIKKELQIEELAGDALRFARISVQDPVAPTQEIFVTIEDKTGSINFLASAPFSAEQVMLAYGVLERLPTWSLERPFSLIESSREDMNGSYRQQSVFDGQRLERKKIAYLPQSMRSTKIDLTHSSFEALYTPNAEGRFLLVSAKGREESKFTFGTQSAAQVRSHLQLEVIEAQSIPCQESSSQTLIAQHSLQPLAMGQYREQMISQLKKSADEQDKPVSDEVFTKGLNELTQLLNSDRLSPAEESRRNALFDQSVHYLQAFPEKSSMLTPLYQTSVAQKQFESLNALSDLLANVDHPSAFEVLGELIKELEATGDARQLARNLMSYQFIKSPNPAVIHLLRSYYERDAAWTHLKEVSLLALSTASGRSQGGEALELGRELKPLLASQQTEKVRIVALESLANLRQNEFIPELKRLTNDPSKDIATRALRSLARFEGEEIVSLILDKALHPQSSQDIRATAFDSLSHKSLTPAESRRVLERYLEFRQNQGDKVLQKTFLNALVNSSFYREIPEVALTLKATPGLESWEKQMLEAQYSPE